MKKIITFCLILFCLAGFFALPLQAREKKVDELLGAGASFPYPLYSKWFDVYAKTHGVKVNYQSIGSGGGIRQLKNKTVDFGASDAYLSKEDVEQFSGKVVHIPTALGAVAVVYNLPIEDQVKITPDLITDIFLGKIKSWQDQKIAEANPGVKLPKMPILVVRRSDGSGTTFIFTDYLSKISREWESKVGRGKSVQWPVGIGGKGNEGVAGNVRNLPGSIGYVEIIYAEKNNLKYARIKNKSGNYLEPTLESISLAANVDLPGDMRVSITNTDAAQGYPIAGFTWLLVYTDQNYDNRSKAVAMATKNLMHWSITAAQQYNEKLLYAKLPKAAQEKAMKLVKSIHYGDDPLKIEEDEKK